MPEMVVGRAILLLDWYCDRADRWVYCMPHALIRLLDMHFAPRRRVLAPMHLHTLDRPASRLSNWKSDISLVTLNWSERREPCCLWLSVVITAPDVLAHLDLARGRPSCD